MTESRARSAEPFQIGGHVVQPGERLRIQLPAALLPTHSQLHVPITVLHARRPGPRLFVSAAIHGDELNGLEIIRQVLAILPDPLVSGTLIAVPIVNVFGFVYQSRYLPDRRDLNRSFPGSRRGSLASRMAHLFMTEVVERATHGLDLHTASTDKTNFPQVRGALDDPETRRCAEAFAAPVMIHSAERPGSLRAAARRRGMPIIVYEAGEPQRFNPDAIRYGVEGVLSVMAELRMVARRHRIRRRRSQLLQSSEWIRARRGGLLRLVVHEGQAVAEGQTIGTITDPFGEGPVPVRAPFDGLVIGRSNNPVVHGGDAVVHLGKLAPTPHEGASSGDD